jgi:hypothetical protein
MEMVTAWKSSGVCSEPRQTVRRGIESVNFASPLLGHFEPEFGRTADAEVVHRAIAWPRIEAADEGGIRSEKASATAAC